VDIDTTRSVALVAECVKLTAPEILLNEIMQSVVKPAEEQRRLLMWWLKLLTTILVAVVYV